MSAQAQKDAQAKSRSDSFKGDLASLGANVASDLISGRGLDGSAIGSGLGAIAGSFIPIPGASQVLGALGGAIGGLFGKKDKEEQQAPVVKGLDAIERAQQETISTIQAQTDALLNPENRLFNLPSDFSVPAYRPGVGNSVSSSTEVHNEVSITVNVQGGNPEDLQRAVEDAVGNGLFAQRRNQGW